MARRNLDIAKEKKDDEYYTQLVDIENELQQYKHHFEGKVVLCNCDDPFESNFFLYFALNFKHLKLKKLISTCYQGSSISEKKGLVCGYKIEFYGIDDLDGDGIITNKDISLYLEQNPPIALDGDGSFDSPECLALLEESDIVVTNPPFSRFKEYVPLLVKYGKKFLIIGNKNALTYKPVFTLIQDNEMWLGYNSPSDFVLPDGTITKKVKGLTRWFTNLDIKKRHQKLDLYMEYEGNEDYFPRYDNYDAIEVSKVVEIPKDYKDIIGVPITFLDKYNPDQFEIIGFSDADSPLITKHYKDYIGYKQDGTKTGRTGSTFGCCPVLRKNDGKTVYYQNADGIQVQAVYARIFVKRKEK